VAAWVSTLLGRPGFDAAFLFAAAGRTPVRTSNTTAAKQCTAFTQMHRSARELWLWGAAKVGEFCDWNPVGIPIVKNVAVTLERSGSQFLR